MADGRHPLLASGGGGGDVPFRGLRPAPFPPPPAHRPPPVPARLAHMLLRAWQRSLPVQVVSLLACLGELVVAVLVLVLAPSPPGSMVYVACVSAMALRPAAGVGTAAARVVKGLVRMEPSRSGSCLAASFSILAAVCVWVSALGFAASCGLAVAAASADSDNAASSGHVASTTVLKSWLAVACVSFALAYIAFPLAALALVAFARPATVSIITLLAPVPTASEAARDSAAVLALGGGAGVFVFHPDTYVVAAPEALPLSLSHRRVGGAATGSEYHLFMDTEVFPGDHDVKAAKTAPGAGRCSVCASLFATGALLRRYPCGHDAHSACAGTWVRSWGAECPLCPPFVAVAEREVKAAGGSQSVYAGDVSQQQQQRDVAAAVAASGFSLNSVYARVRAGTSAIGVAPGPPAHSPAHSPSAHSPSAHSPTAHSPTAHSPTAHGHSAHGHSAHSPTAHGHSAHSPTAQAVGSGVVSLGWARRGSGAAHGHYDHVGEGTRGAGAVGKPRARVQEQEMGLLSGRKSPVLSKSSSSNDQNSATVGPDYSYTLEYASAAPASSSAAGLGVPRPPSSTLPPPSFASEARGVSQETEASEGEDEAPVAALPPAAPSPVALSPRPSWRAKGPALRGPPS